MENSEPNDKGLLVEGARSYLEAMTAMVHYQQEIQKRCRGVMAGYLGEYASTLGVGLESGDIQDMAWPETKQWEGNHASIGARIAKSEVIPGIRWWEAYCCLEWQSEEPKFWCYIGEWFPTRKLATGLYERFHRLNAQGLWAGGRDLGICTSVKPEEAGSLEEILEDLALKWIKLWKKVGGMKGFLKE